MRAYLSAATTALLFASGLGATTNHLHHTNLRAKLCAGRQVLHTSSIPAHAQTQSVNATVNGHVLNGWAEGPMVAGLGGYGVVAQVTLMRKTGPATVRLASARDDCVRVRVVIAWR